MKPYDWHLGLRLRRLLGGRLRIDRRQAFEVTAETRLTLREVMPIAHSLAPKIPGWPKIIPVSTIQRRSEYRWISDTPVIVYDQEYVHSLGYLFKFWCLTERPVFSMVELLIRVAEYSIDSGELRYALAISQAAHRILDSDARRSDPDGRYPFLYRPQVLSAVPDLSALSRLVGVFVLSHEIGHFLAENPTSSAAFQEAVHSIYSKDSSEEIDQLISAHRFVKPELEYTFDSAGKFIKAASRATQLLSTRSEIERGQRVEVTADAFALWLTSLYASRNGIYPGLLWDMLLKLYEFLDVLELITWTFDHSPRRGAAERQVVAFPAIRTTAARARSILRVLAATISSPQIASREFCSFWTGDKNVRQRIVDPKATEYISVRLDMLAVAQRRALFEIVCPELARERPGETPPAPDNYGPLGGNLYELQRHQSMPEYFWSNSALQGMDPGYDELDASFIGAIHALKAVFEVRWDIDQALRKYGRHYLSLCGRCGVSRALDLVRRPRLDVGDQCMHFPPEAEWRPSFVFANNPLGAIKRWDASDASPSRGSIARPTQAAGPEGPPLRGSSTASPRRRTRTPRPRRVPPGSNIR